MQGSEDHAGRVGAPTLASGVATTMLSRASLDLLAGAAAVTDPGRKLVVTNHRFDLEIRSGGIGGTCCEIFGCEEATGGGCITDRVVSTGRPWEGTATIQGSDGEREVVATPLGAGVRHVVFRFGEEHTESGSPQPSAQLQIRCMGPLRIGDESALDSPDWLEQRPGLLLKYLLAMRHRHVSNEELLEALWEPHTVAPASVRYVVHQLRTRLGGDRHAGPASFIRTTPRGYRLNLDMVWLDADAYEAAVRTAVTAAVRGDMRSCEQHVLRALNLYRGDFLEEDPYAEWALEERDRLHALLETPLRLLVDVRLDGGDVEGAVALAERLAHHEPLDADVQMLLIGLLLRIGRRSRAMRHYEIFRARLWRALGVEPPFDIADLVRGWTDTARGDAP